MVTNYRNIVTKHYYSYKTLTKHPLVNNGSDMGLTNTNNNGSQVQAINRKMEKVSFSSGSESIERISEESPKKKGRSMRKISHNQSLFTHFTNLELF